jgi:mono/diheme cytochrome c family protein
MKATALLLTSLALWGCDAGPPSGGSEARGLDVPVRRLASKAARERGRALFLEKCALCHGRDADGRGVRQQGLSGKPADFTRRTWRESVDPASVFRILSEGKRGTSMPAWPSLRDDQKWDLVAYVLSVAERGA